MFLFKKVLSQFFLPLPMCLTVCLAGVALLWWTQKQRTGKVLVTAGLLALTAISYAPLADALIAPLETQFPPFNAVASGPVSFVVVLGGGHSSNRDQPVSSQLGNESVKRLVEGVRIYRQNPGSKLLVSGGACFDPTPDATLLAELARELGVPAADLVLEDQSWDTADEARLIKPMVGTNHFVLVTSANHMPRSVALFKAQNLEPIPAAADHQVTPHRLEPSIFFPNGLSLRKSEHAFYEYMGLAWTALNRSR